MRNIHQEIQNNLNGIEEQYGVKIILAVESGSRAWGFASPDSDYDVRFIYAHPKDEYLRVDTMPDVIEWHLDDVLDINGWDLKKALLAFAKGNPNIMEWANSGIVYRSTDVWNQISKYAFHYFSQKAALCHYYGTAKTTLETHLKNEMIRYKKYFYALRPLLCCKWIERYHEVPPMEFQALLTLFDGNDPDLDPELFTSIQALLERKAVTEEKDLNPQMPVIIDFIRSECDKQKTISESLQDDHRRDFDEINRIFRMALDLMADNW